MLNESGLAILVDGHNHTRCSRRLRRNCQPLVIVCAVPWQCCLIRIGFPNGPGVRQSPAFLDLKDLVRHPFSGNRHGHFLIQG